MLEDFQSKNISDRGIPRSFRTLLKAARIPAKGHSIELGDDVDNAFTTRLANAPGLQRATKIMPSAVPPVGG